MKPIRLLLSWLNLQFANPARNWQCEHLNAKGLYCQRLAGHAGKHNP